MFGPLKMQNVAPRLSGTPGAVRHVGPELGEHTEAVLRGLLGLGAGTLAEWRARGIV